MDSKDTAFAWPVREINHFWASVKGSLQAVIAQADVALGLSKTACSRAADRHTESLKSIRAGNINVTAGEPYWRKSPDRLLLQTIRSKVVLSVVDGHATSGTRSKGSVVDDRHAMVGTISRVLEVQNCSPVVGKVLRHLAGGTGSPLANISRHLGGKGISANNVVNVRRWALARLNDRVKALGGQRRTGKAKARLDRCDERECDRD